MEDKRPGFLNEREGEGEPSLTFWRASKRGFWFFLFRYCHATSSGDEIKKTASLSAPEQRGLCISDGPECEEGGQWAWSWYLAKEVQQALDGEGDEDDDGTDQRHHPRRCELQL